MSQQSIGLRIVACQTFNEILQKLSRGSIGYNLLTKAATHHAQGSNRTAFDELVESLSWKEVQLRVQVLKLINLLIYTAPSEKKKAQFLARLENLGLYDEMRKIGRENGNDKSIVD